MVKINGQWGTVCDDGFTQTSAEAACYTLGLRGGSYSYRSAVTGMKKGDSIDTDPMKIWMDSVECTSGTSDFYHGCSYRAEPLRTEDYCDGHWEDIFLYCS